ncbi:MAG: hypothetical protein GX183_09295 [Firmicutes bacterium]|jgi:vancomycin resistance protein YoaR|nr:hypothetical protein [Bacillota bacterium]
MSARRGTGNILKTAAIIAALCLVVGFAAAARCALPVLFDDRTIAEGVTVAGFDLSGLSLAEARRLLEDYAYRCINSPVEMRLMDEAWIAFPRDVGTEIHVEAALSGAYAVGRTGSLWARHVQRKTAAREGIEIPLIITVDPQRLTDMSFAISAEVRRDPVDARLTITDDDQVVIEPSSEGRGLIVRKLTERFREATLNPEDRIIDLPVDVLRPAVSTADLEAMGLRRLVARFTTKFNPENHTRTTNVRLGARHIDGVLVPPGGVFSFNDVVGPRTADRGFLEADVIVNSELVPGVGGGICQVSTTLYNAALLAGLEIVSRMNHSLPVSYVPLGRDATVSYGAIDLKFRNNTSGYVLIKAGTDDDTITVKIFGDMPEGVDISVQTEVTERIEPGSIQRVDPSAPPGSSKVTEEGAPGYRVSVYRITKIDGVEFSRELISNDRYKPKPSVITVGPASGSQAPSAPQGVR